jgi:DnaJ homologue, subfamily C, member 28, conserved domain
VLDDDALVPQELRMAYRVLKNAGCLPPELELRQEIQALEGALAHLGGAGERRRALKRLSFLRTRLEVTGRCWIDLLAQQWLERLDQSVRQDRTSMARAGIGLIAAMEKHGSVRLGAGVL